MYTDNELLFPRHVIRTLKRFRGPKWQALVEYVAALPESHEETLAFMLLMIRLSGCMSCETDSYRAMRGCTSCSHQTLRRYKDSDEDLLALYEEALVEVREFTKQNPPTDIISESRWRPISTTPIQRR